MFDCVEFEDTDEGCATSAVCSAKLVSMFGRMIVQTKFNQTYAKLNHWLKNLKISMFLHSD